MHHKYPHVVDYHKTYETRGDNTLHVIGVITNPSQWQSRYRLFHAWLEDMQATRNVKVHLIEGVYGDLQPQCEPTEGMDYNYMCVQLDSEIWLKENLINIAVRNLLPNNWRYMAWVDCDVHFRDPRWAIKTINALQKYDILQPWSHSVALNSQGGVFAADSSFGFLHATGRKKSWGRHQANLGYGYAHTGYAWACTRRFYENVKGLIDFCIIGSGDHHMAWAAIGMSKYTVHGQMCQAYKDEVARWEQRALNICGGRVGYIDGRIEHTYHGTAKNRNYVGRWDIPLKHKFNPHKHVKYDHQGVLVLDIETKLQFETDVIQYNYSRDEDSNNPVDFVVK